MFDATPPSPVPSGSPGFSSVTGGARSGALGRIITDGEVVARTLDRPRERSSGWDSAGSVEVADAARARAARSEARRALFAIAGDLDRAERTLAEARTSGDAAAIVRAERTVAEHSAKLSDSAARVNELSDDGRESITPERVFALLSWKGPGGGGAARNG